jgi:hypothetical protein
MRAQPTSRRPGYSPGSVSHYHGLRSGRAGLRPSGCRRSLAAVAGAVALMVEAVSWRFLD